MGKEDTVWRFIYDEFVSKFEKLLDGSPGSNVYYRPRPYRNAAVRLRACSMEDFKGRYDTVVGIAGLNVFRFPADEIPGCDLLSDSGTTTMTMEQWSRLLLGDEAYGSNAGYFELKDQILDTFGEFFERDYRHKDRENVFIFHQGRAAERALFYTLSRAVDPRPHRELSAGIEPELRETLESEFDAWDEGRKPFYVIPSNSHFDTTEANIEHGDVNVVALNIPCEEASDKASDYPFKGNMNVALLKSLLEHERERVPIIYLTITNNTGGGQPVSMENIKVVAALARENGIPLFFDACRFAENAWFIQQKEDGYAGKSVAEIVREMFGHVDGFHISFKKDGLVNIGGGIVVKEGGNFDKAYPTLRDRLTDYQILAEGHPTYGGLAGRDLLGIAEGLRTVTEQKYLDARIGQTGRFAKRLTDYNIPIIEPPGGHAVYIDVDRFFDVPESERDPGDFRGIAVTGLLLIAGHRLCELGVFTFGKNKNGKSIPPNPWVNNIRGAIPRMTYEDQDLFALAEAIRILYENRDKIPSVKVEYGEGLGLRHFKSRFSFDISKK